MRQWLRDRYRRRDLTIKLRRKESGLRRFRIKDDRYAIPRERWQQEPI